jgi:hypothetical protein
MKSILIIVTALQVALALTLTAAAVLGADAPQPEKPRLVVLNFVSSFDSGDLGQRAAYALRAKLRRSQRFSIPDELDFDELEGSVSPSRPGLEDAAAAERLAARFRGRFVIWGEVTKDKAYHISLKSLDLEGDAPPLALSKDAADLRQFALASGDLADEIAKGYTGSPFREIYPTKSAEGCVRVSPNLVANGDFEKGAPSPDNWERPDGLCSFLDSDKEHGRFIRFDTDVYLSEWQDWRKRFDAGEPPPAAPPKTPTSGDKYDTVGGTYGVHLYSDSIAVKPGATYSIEFDAKGLIAGDFFFGKVFVKGFGKEGASMELYNMYKAVRVDAPSRWQHFSRIFSPTERTPGVVTMKVMLFAYWPPGEYSFDNVAIYEVKPAAK